MFLLFMWIAIRAKSGNLLRTFGLQPGFSTRNIAPIISEPTLYDEIGRFLKGSKMSEGEGKPANVGQSEQPNSPGKDLGGVIQDVQRRLAAGRPLDFEAVAAAFPDLVERLLPLFAKAETYCLSAKDSKDSEISLAAADLTPPQVRALGDFQLVREIGRGGMGIVYEANQISLSRRVAVKIFPFAAICAPHQLQRFQIEARAAASLHHSHIVPVFTVGCDRGIYYYAMQYIEGRSLSCLLQELHVASSRRSEGDSTPPLTIDPSGGTQSFGETRISSSQPPFPSLRQIAEWGVQLADALHYAHSLGIVHRDVKPANILLDKDGRVWITDFGIAQMASSDQLTLTGDVLGSLPYASPEQAAGQRAQVDHRADIYGLGATLYEFLARQALFKYKDRADAIKQVISGEPTEIRKVNPQVPKELATIVHKAIEREVTGRYQSAQDLAEDLRRFLQDRPISARPATAVDRLRKWARRNPIFIRTSAAFLVLSALVVAVSAFLIDRERQQALFERHTRETDLKMAHAARKSMEINRYVTLVNHAERAFDAGKISEARSILEKCRPESDAEDFRGFDWHYLWNATGDGARPPFGQHQGMAYSLHLSPDRSMLASAGQDGVRIWHAASGSLLQHLTAHRGDVNDARFSPDGTKLATSGDDGMVRIWNVVNWSIEQELPHVGAAVAARFVPGRTLLATAERDFDRTPGQFVGRNVVHLWETDAWTSRGTLQAHTDDIHCLDISADGSLIATASSDRTVAVWDLTSNTLKDHLHLPALDGMKSFGAQCVKFSHREPVLAMAGSDGTLRFLNLESRTVTLAPWISRSGLQFVTFSPNEERVVAGGDFAKITAMTKVSAKEFNEESSNTFWPTHHQWAAEFLDDHRFWTAGRDGSIRFWDTQHAYGLRRVPVSKVSWCECPAFTRDGKYFLVPGRGVAVYQVSDGTCVRQFGGETSLTCVATSPDGKTAVTASVSGELTTWNLMDGSPRESMETRIDVPNQLTYALNGEAVYVRNTHHRRYKTVSKQLMPMEPPGPEFRSHSNPWFAASSNFVATTENLTAIQIWRGSSLAANLTFDNQEPQAAAWTDDGTRLAVSWKNGTIRVYDTKGLSLVSEIITGEPQNHLVFSPDGKVLVGADSTSETRSIHLWNAATGHQLLKLSTGCTAIQALRFSPDGMVLAATGTSVSGEGEILFWSGRNPDASN